MKKEEFEAIKNVLNDLIAMMENKKTRSAHFTAELMCEYWIEVIKGQIEYYGRKVAK